MMKPLLPEPPDEVALVRGAEPLEGYRLVRRINRGGCGEVWEAEGPGDAAAALKFVALEGAAGDAELRALNLMKDISHPHLVAMHGAWERGGFLIIAMTLAEGTLLDCLRQAVRDGHAGIPLAPLLQYLSEAAAGIDHLNECGIQHRDVKPQNLLLVGGAVQVADFGLAKFLEKTSVSHTGQMTPLYAAPESFRGQLTRRSDQYSLAATYCQLRGNRLPFEGNAAQVTRGHLELPPDLTMLPEAERAVLAQALAKEPQQRFPSCGDFVRELQSCAGEGEAVAPRRSGPALQMATQPFVPAEEESASTTPTILNAIGMELVLIPAGTFVMGSPDSEPGRDRDEGPRHEVRVTRPFYLGVYPVTQREYEAVTGTNPAHFNRLQGGGPDHPVEQVSWEEARAFCARLSALPAEQRLGRTYRLPTEAEWEYACRAAAPVPTIFHLGDSLSSRQANFDGNHPHGDASRGPCLGKTCKVGSYRANAFGLHDLHGNVWEWCADWYDEGYYRQSPAQDPQGPPGGAYRVVRGGSWHNVGAGCRSANRNRIRPGTRSSYLGFRVVAEPGG